MLTQIQSEFWVIMSEKTPPFPTTNRLPLLIENSQTKDIEFKITNPYDPEVKVFDNAAAAQFNIDTFKDACKRQGHEVNFGIYLFKVECNVRMASAAEVNGWSNNTPPIEPSVPIPELDKPLVFKRIRVKYFDRDGTPKTDTLPVDQFVPLTLQTHDDECPCIKKRLIFIGNESKLNQMRQDTHFTEASMIANSLYVKEEEYRRLLKVYRKFQNNPRKFIKGV